LTSGPPPLRPPSQKPLPMNRVASPFLRRPAAKRRQVNSQGREPLDRSSAPTHPSPNGAAVVVHHAPGRDLSVAPVGVRTYPIPTPHPALSRKGRGFSDRGLLVARSGVQGLPSLAIDWSPRWGSLGNADNKNHRRKFLPSVLSASSVAKNLPREKLPNWLTNASRN
jgi:hypothetical protein